MKKEKWSRLSQTQKVDILNERVTLLECDAQEAMQNIIALHQRLEQAEDYIREVDNRLDSIALCLQELVNILHKNRQITSEQTDMVIAGS